MKRSHFTSLVIAIGMIAVTAVLLRTMFFERPSPDDSAQDARDDIPAEADTTLVRLSASKADIAGIEFESVGEQSIWPMQTVPARFGYDESAHVTVRTPIDGVLETVIVQPGTPVQKGDLIATLRSPAIGTARSQLLQRLSELDLAATQSDWQSTVQSGVRQLVAAIRRRDSIETIKKDLESSVLGKYRGELLGKYSDLLLAQSLNDSLAEIRGTGAISGKVLIERQTKLNEAVSSLESALEQASFDVDQAGREFAAKTRVAGQAVASARHHLANLTGRPLPDDSNSEPFIDESSLSVLRILSPIDGTVQQRHHNATERVDAGDALFIIADTTKLWVRAELRGRDLNAAVVRGGDTLRVIPDTHRGIPTQGTVQFVGREIDPISGTVPMVAAVDNPQDVFRPGLFARVDVPVGPEKRSVVIPASAVIDLDGQTSVFVLHDGGYRPTAVAIGIRNGESCEVTSGLEVGDQVVTRGVFTLKSELLLEGEE